jgi:hypothetical protein
VETNAPSKGRMKRREECEAEDVDGLGWEEEVIQSEDGIGIGGKLDPERCCLDYVVEVASWGDCGWWVKCWRQLGVKSLTLVAFTEGAWSLAHEIWGVEVDVGRPKDVLSSSYKKECDIFVCHVPSETCLTSYFLYLNSLGTRVWILTTSAQGLSRTTMKNMRVAAGDLNFQMCKVSHAAPVGGATRMEFWVISGLIGNLTSNVLRDPRKVAYTRRRAIQFMDLASKKPCYKEGLSVEDPAELLTVRSDLCFRVRAKSVFTKGQEIIRELSDAEIAQLLDWRKELSHVIPWIRRHSQDTTSLPLPVRVPVVIILGAMQ